MLYMERIGESYRWVKGSLARWRCLKCLLVDVYGVPQGCVHKGDTPVSERGRVGCVSTECSRGQQRRHTRQCEQYGARESGKCVYGVLN